MDINFEHYKIFYYVAKYGNITKAAAALGSNQPNVTRIIKLLESQYNCRLLVREARGIRLTEEGTRLYAHVEIAYQHLANAQEEICGRDFQRAGTVEIGVTETALHLFLLEALHGFKSIYSAIRIKIHNHGTPEILRRLAGGALDFAVVTTPFETSGTIRCEKVMDFREVLVAGIQYRELGERTWELKELRNHPWVGLGRGTATYELYKDFFIRNGVDMELDMEVATSDLILPLIVNNFGIGFVSEDLAGSFLHTGSLVRVPVKCELPCRSIQIVSDKGRGRSLAADTLYKYLCACGRSDIAHDTQYEERGSIDSSTTCVLRSK